MRKEGYNVLSIKASTSSLHTPATLGTGHYNYGEGGGVQNGRRGGGSSKVLPLQKVGGRTASTSFHPL